MDRREFIKISSLASLWIAANPSSVLADTFKAESKIANSKKVLLFKAMNSKTGEWKISGTMFVDLANKRLKKSKWDHKTFEILCIVEDHEATEIRNQLWEKHIGTPAPNLPLFTHKAQDLGLDCKEKGIFGVKDCKATLALKESGYLQSDQNKEIYRQIGKKQGRINKESGHMPKMWKSLADSDYWGSEEQKSFSRKSGKTGGKIQGALNAKNGHMTRIQKIGAVPGGRATAKLFEIERMERYKKIYPHLPSSGFSRGYVNKVASSLDVVYNSKVFASFIDHGLIEKIYDGKKGSNTDVPLFRKVLHF